MTALVLSLAAPPGPPQLKARGSMAIQAQWKKVKELTEPREQVKRIKKQKLDRVRCTDVGSLVELLRRTPLPYGLRDTVRWRTAARPEMLALLVDAGRALRRKRPEAWVTVGDIAQQGCGQIRYGTLVRFVGGTAAKGLEARARTYYGELGFMEPVPPEVYIDEHPRFSDILGPVWVERRLTGRSKGKVLRVETRRFDSGRTLPAVSVSRLLERTRNRLRQRSKVVWDRVKHQLPGGRVATLRRATWRDAGKQRFIEVVWRPTKRLFPLRAETLLRIRESRLDLRKPTSPKYEERYRFQWDGDAGVRVDRHLLQYEAHHASHIGGFDADLSYVTRQNRHHFAPRAQVIDPDATWIWLDALRTSAKRLGIPLTALFVDGSIRRILKSARGAKRRHPLWRLLRRSPGHDSHVHVRIGRSPRWAGKSIGQILRSVGVSDARRPAKPTRKKRKKKRSGRRQ